MRTRLELGRCAASQGARRIRHSAKSGGLLRGLLSGIRLIPEGTGLAIELTGELAGIMALGEARNDKTPARGGGSGRLTMVAGAGFEPAAFRL